ncbi:MAG: alpha/beta hydrolase [Alphaproteobacteria bacterium]
MKRRSLGFLVPLLASLSPPARAAEAPIALNTATGTLHGTLLLPETASPMPVVLLIAGSGPTDRDGNNPLFPGRNDSLKLLAEGLAQHGIASIRYDKRGIAASTFAGPRHESDMRFDMLVDDTAAWLRLLRADPRFSKVVAIGHSEGSLVALLAASAGGANGVVSIAGSARRISDLLREQLRPRLPPELLQQNETILLSLERGETIEAIPAALAPLYRPSVQPYLVSLFRHAPTDIMAKLQIPALIIGGTADLQVPPTDAEALQRAKPDAELLIIDGMNHVLKAVSADAPNALSAYGDPTLPVEPLLIERIAAFVQRLPN